MRPAQKKGAAWGDLLVVLAVLALAVVVWIAALSPKSEQGLTVQVVLDGEVILSRSLDTLKEPITFPVEGVWPLTLELSKGGVRVAETACPGADCLHTGTISRAGRQIICLPNRLVVTLEGDAPSYDAIIG